MKITTKEEANKWKDDILVFIRNNKPECPIYVCPMQISDIDKYLSSTEASLNNFETLSYYWRMKCYQLNKIKKYIEENG